MEFKTTDISEIVTDIWTAMLGFPVQPQDRAGAGGSGDAPSRRA